MLVKFINSVRDMTSSTEVKQALEELTYPCVKYINLKLETISYFAKILALSILVQVLTTIFLLIVTLKKNIQ